MSAAELMTFVQNLVVFPTWEAGFPRKRKKKKEKKEEHAAKQHVRTMQFVNWNQKTGSETAAWKTPAGLRQWLGKPELVSRPQHCSVSSDMLGNSDGGVSSFILVPPDKSFCWHSPSLRRPPAKQQAMQPFLTSYITIWHTHIQPNVRARIKRRILMRFSWNKFPQAWNQVLKVSFF